MPSRRAFLKYVGCSAAVYGGTQLLGPLVARAGGQAVRTVFANAGMPAFAAVAYPIPSPGDDGNAGTDPERFARYEVRDELLLPDGYEYQVIAKYGDRFGPPEAPIVFGTAADFTGLVPIEGASEEYFLIVNHEYISARPWLQSYPVIYGRSLVDEQGRAGKLPLLGAALDLSTPEIAGSPFAPAIDALCDAAMRDLGVSILHVQRTPNGHLRVIGNSPRHLRIWGHGAQNASPRDFSFTGPSAPLLPSPRGTFANCSGAVTPWGTFLSCEENFQDQVPEFINPAGKPLAGDIKRFAGLGEEHPTNRPFEFEGLGTGIEPPLDGRQYGWVVEIDPVRRTMKKHTALGRFRHENVALRVEAGKPLVAYQGDDRRGGHVWKFVSDGIVQDPADPANSALFASGTLYAARWREDFTGDWIAIRPETPLSRPSPEHCATGHLWLPSRPAGGHVAVGTPGGKSTQQSPDDWIKAIEQHTGKAFDQTTLGDLVAARGIIEMDAYVMANAAGATPCSRPEDIEVHPADASVYVAFTDSTGSGDGSPDVRIFPDSRGTNSRQYGTIYRLVEADNDPAATRFTWGKFIASGEASEGGGAFACADNMVFDPQGNLWMVCDITTPRHNYPVTRTEADKTNPGASGFVGIFGNNAMFMIPTTGPASGVPRCFAIGPTECELTGPTFTEDGRTLLIAVQHPGELHGTRGYPGVNQPAEVQRTMALLTRDGKPFTQNRTVPLGSNFPGGKGQVPLAAVVSITRKAQ